MVYYRQHGFRKAEGAEEALILSIKTWKEIINYGTDEKGKSISGSNVLFYDFSKAFDRTWREGIYYKLRQAGIYGHTYNQIKDYLEKKTTICTN